MANAPSAKKKAGQSKLLPCYIGVTEGKDPKGVKTTHSHYVLIAERVATRLGIKGKSIKKPGGSDVIENGIVYQTNRKKAKGTGKVEAKRFLKQYQKKIMLYCKGTVKNTKGKDVQETYSVSFPSGVPLRLIRKFLEDNCPNVVRYGTGNQLYQVR
jgi:hypothetical protein